MSTKGKSKGGKSTKQRGGRRKITPAQYFRELAGKTLPMQFGLGGCGHKKKGGSIINAALNHLPMPEMHLRELPSMKKYSFCGPYTRLDKRLNSDDTWKSWSAPVNTLDKHCYYHDLAYRDAKDTATRNKADVILSKGAKDVINNPNTGTSEKANAKLVKGIMNTKARFGLGKRKKKIKS